MSRRRGKTTWAVLVLVACGAVLAGVLKWEALVTQPSWLPHHAEPRS
jgi:hypothetical protein